MPFKSYGDTESLRYKNPVGGLKGHQTYYYYSFSLWWDLEAPAGSLVGVGHPQYGGLVEVAAGDVHA